MSSYDKQVFSNGAINRACKKLSAMLDAKFSGETDGPYTITEFELAQLFDKRWIRPSVIDEIRIRMLENHHVTFAKAMADRYVVLTEDWIQFRELPEGYLEPDYDPSQDQDQQVGFPLFASGEDDDTEEDSEDDSDIEIIEDDPVMPEETEESEDEDEKPKHRH